MKGRTQSFEDLLVWQKAHQLVLAVYKATKAFPREELYGLVSQIRRSFVSTAANIAEGFRKRTQLDKKRYLTMAHGSLEETRYYLILSRDLQYCEITTEMRLLEEVSKLLTLYYRKIATS